MEFLLVAALSLVAVVVIVVSTVNGRPLARWQHAIGIIGGLMLVAGTSFGLLLSPPEKHMGDVSRILYAHVPSAWNCLLIFTFAFGFAVASLWTGDRKWDARMVGAVEVGIVISVIMLLTGSIFGHPTWGVWWTWDVRLTTSLLATILFTGVLALRAFVPDPSRRATWSAAATIFAWVDIPMIYFCVRWWRSLHQIQSSPETVSEMMLLPLRTNAIGLLLVALWMIMVRTRIEEQRFENENVPMPERLVPEAQGAQ